MRCPACGHENPEGARFCNERAAKMELAGPIPAAEGTNREDPGLEGPDRRGTPTSNGHVLRLGATGTGADGPANLKGDPSVL